MVVNQRLTMFIEEHKDVVHAKEISLQVETCHLRLWGTLTIIVLWCIVELALLFLLLFFKIKGPRDKRYNNAWSVVCM